MNTLLFDHLKQQQCAPELVEVLRVTTCSCKKIAWKVNLGAFANVIGSAESTNVQGEIQQKLDVLSNDILKKDLLSCSQIAGIASEEEDRPVAAHDTGKYIAAFDPLDGSSNINVNISIGTIFSILPYTAGESLDTAFLKTGSQQVAAGYVLYGTSTILVLTIGTGVHFYGLDCTLGEFVLIQEFVRVTEQTAEFAINMSNYRFWSSGIRNYIDACIAGETEKANKRYNMRWVASMVADVHRILVRGGIFMYPWDSRNPEKAGKLRLIYEASPMSFLIEQAGGLSTDTKQRILDIEPHAIHQRVPVILGSPEEVQICVEYCT